ncbi:hypothetical protein BE08_25850 [Sorangium cellulosum]|uniref:Uncharacterized protein n=1 Tax=Sorangium cellulosum TaxID=56 RepID=A0A150PR71_SORCE|nr:hypothetical protein BE08_25850 [Sorangium cellulosum]
MGDDHRARERGIVVTERKWLPAITYRERQHLLALIDQEDDEALPGSGQPELVQQIARLDGPVGAGACSSATAVRGREGHSQRR